MRLLILMLLISGNTQPNPLLYRFLLYLHQSGHLEKQVDTMCPSVSFLPSPQPQPSTSYTMYFPSFSTLNTSLAISSLCRICTSFLTRLSLFLVIKRSIARRGTTNITRNLGGGVLILVKNGLTYSPLAAQHLSRLIPAPYHSKNKRVLSSLPFQSLSPTYPLFL